MPYLHWETSHKLTKMTENIHEITQLEKKRARSSFPEISREKIKFLSSRVVNSVKHRPKNKEMRKWPRNCLGRYLMSVAQVYEAMDDAADENLLRSYLYKRSPLHVRRTLDQAYFSTLDDTGSRSMDQVVYRGTQGALHSWSPKSPKVVMVDQLWMWILDESKF